MVGLCVCEKKNIWREREVFSRPSSFPIARGDRATIKFEPCKYGLKNRNGRMHGYNDLLSVLDVPTICLTW